MTRTTYGNTRTHLILTDKALKAYSEIDPLLIEEVETEDGYRYNLTGATEAENLTEDDLIRGLEELYDELMEDNSMTYLEYMKNHPDENMGWCRPYVSKDGEYAILKHDGEPEIARTPVGDLYRYNGTLSDEALEQIARAVNPDYGIFEGWTDEQIAIIAMHETGCASCPWRDKCEAMGEMLGE